MCAFDEKELISILCLDDSNMHSHFENRKCIIKCDYINVDLAIRQDKVYLILNCDHVNEIKPSSTMNVCDLSSKHKQNENQSSSKLWRYRLRHISRGIERFVQKEIVHSLDFLDSNQCIVALRENM